MSEAQPETVEVSADTIKSEVVACMKAIADIIIPLNPVAVFPALAQTLYDYAQYHGIPLTDIGPLMRAVHDSRVKMNQENEKRVIVP